MPLSSSPLLTIIGTGPGVSLAVARRFHREGFRLALVARNARKVDGYAADLQTDATLPEVRGYAADVSEPASLRAVFDAIHAAQGPTDALVYNPSVFHETMASALDFNTLVDDFKICCAGLLPAVQAVLPSMRRRGAGTILVTGGGTALEPYPLYASLSVGKAAVRNLTLSLHEELRPAGIHVATVTIAGAVAAGGRFDPGAIAEAYWELYRQPADQRTREVIFRGS